MPAAPREAVQPGWRVGPVAVNGYDLPGTGHCLRGCVPHPGGGQGSKHQHRGGGVTVNGKVPAWRAHGGMLVRTCCGCRATVRQRGVRWRATAWSGWGGCPTSESGCSACSPPLNQYTTQGKVAPESRCDRRICVQVRAARMNRRQHWTDSSGGFGHVASARGQAE